ncbi:uncharacterized protein LOC141850917 isoform X2 [Brevipalpus obovatus]|uniref:uncharacterized protein LOC141850917 isoform X2 n=1 Tax=Brevipalpus obovatus TaxID=246614 RepID=UPI003D9E452E
MAKNAKFHMTIKRSMKMDWMDQGTIIAIPKYLRVMAKVNPNDKRFLKSVEHLLNEDLNALKSEDDAAHLSRFLQNGKSIHSSRRIEIISKILDKSEIGALERFLRCNGWKLLNIWFKRMQIRRTMKEKEKERQEKKKAKVTDETKTRAKAKAAAKATAATRAAAEAGKAQLAILRLMEKCLMNDRL